MTGRDVVGLACGVDVTDGGGVDRELNRLAEGELEDGLGKFDGLTFIHVLGDDAEHLLGGGAIVASGDADVVGASEAAEDAAASDLALSAVVGRAKRNGEIE